MVAETHVVGPDWTVSSESPADKPVVVRVSGDESGGSSDPLEVGVPAGSGVTPMHTHYKMNEAMDVLDGELTVQMGGPDERH